MKRELRTLTSLAT